MYIVDFLQSLFKTKNTGVIIYLVLNIFFVIAIFASMEISPIIGLFIYAISVSIALSPVGEWILRVKLGCKKIKRKEHVERLLPIFNEVYAKAKEQDPTLPDDVKLFLHNSEALNAFATGRKTICLNKGLLNISDDEIRATLAHEFGHLSAKDTDLILLITVGNFIVTAMYIFFRILFGFISFIATMASNSFGPILTGLLVDGVLVLAMWLWTKIGILLVMHSSRQNEYVADKFAYDAGYGIPLISLLDRIGDGTEGESGLFANLASSHPDTDLRIAAIQELEGQITERFEY